MCEGVRPVTLKVGLGGAGSAALVCPPASEARAASAVSMVTAAPASPPRGEDAACGARRLAPGLMGDPGPLRRKVPAAGLWGSGHQVSVRRGRAGEGRGENSSSPPPPPQPRAHSHQISQRRFSGRHCARGFGFASVFVLFSPGCVPGKGRQRLMERPREAVFEFYPNWESSFRPPDSPTGFPSFSVRSHSPAGDPDGLK